MLLQEGSIDGLAIIQGGAIKCANRTLLDMFGLKDEEEMVEHTFADFISPDFEQIVDKRDSDIFEYCSTPRLHELKGRRRDGSTFDIELSISPVQYRGDPAMQGIVRDISRRKQAEAELRASEEQYRLLFEEAPLTIVIVDSSGVVIDCNRITETMTGYSREQIVGLRFDHLPMLDARDLPGINEYIQKVSSGEVVESYNLEITRKDGEKRWVRVRNSLMKRADKLIGLKIYATDITERKRTEDALRASEEKLRVIFDSIEEAITVTDLEGRIIEANRACVRNSGFSSKEELLGRSGLEFISERDRARCAKDILKAVGRQWGTTERYTFVDNGGREYQGWASGTLMWDENGNPAGFINVAKDMSDIVQAQEALEASEERYRSVVENAGEVIIVAQDGRLKFFNPQAMEITGYSSSELANKPFVEMIHPDDRNMVAERHIKRLQGDKLPGVYPFRIIDKQGNVKWMEINAVAIQWEGRPATLNFLSEITERRRAEDALRESEEKLRILFESIGDAITITDLSGRIVDMNQASLRMGGFEHKEELVGVAGYELVAHRDRARVLKDMKVAFTRGEQSLVVHYAFLAKDGREYDAEATIALLRDASGRPVGVVAVAKDITERKRMESLIQFYITEITRAQEEERKRIACELHDDTAQGLAALMLDVEAIIHGKEQLPDRTLNELELIRDKANMIMEGVRRFSTELRPGILDQLGLLPSLQWLTDGIGHDIKARLDVFGAETRLPPEVEVALFRIAQEVINNIRRHAKATRVVVRIDFSPDNVKLHIRDNGCGFKPPEVLTDFATAGKLGILGMHERARIIGGNLFIQSHAGKGTTVSVEVPR